MEEKIEIKNIIEKQALSGKKYWKVKTLSGIYGIFDSEIAKEISQIIGKTIIADILVSPDGKYKTIKDFEVLQSFVEPIKTSVLDKDRLIVRQSCLKASIEYSKGDIDSILRFAEEFENWVFREK